MVETAVKIARCGACGADVRDESVFCYNCGVAVTKEPAVEELALEERVAEIEPQPVPAPAESRPLRRSASSLRRERRAFNRQPLKVSWEQREGSPKAFIITTIAFVIGAAILLGLSLYLR